MIQNLNFEVLNIDVIISINNYKYLRKLNISHIKHYFLNNFSVSDRETTKN